MADIYIFNYNNYYNREIKSPLPFDEMVQQYNYIHKQMNVNFNPNDEVNTMLTVGKAGELYDGKGDYLLVYDHSNGDKISRWFIIDHKRKCKGQWTLSLHRDVIADNYTAVVNSTCFVERGTVSEISPFIYNHEPIPVNQIKTSETLLKDSTGCAWICGFLNKNYDGGQLDLTLEDFIPDITVDGISNWDYYDDVNKSVNVLYGRKPVFRWVESRAIDYGGPFETIAFEQWSGITKGSVIILEPTQADMLRGGTTDLYSNPLGNMKSQQWAQDYLTTLGSSSVMEYWNLGRYYGAGDDWQKVLRLKGQIIFDSKSGKYYQIAVTESAKQYNYVNITEDKRGELFSRAKQLIIDAAQLTDVQSNPWPSNTIAVRFEYTEGFITLQEVTGGTAKFIMPTAQNRLHLKDAPYDMFCIPYGNVTITNSKQSTFKNLTIDPNRSVQVAQEIARAVGTANIYDLQLLPYCPMTGFEVSGNIIDINTTNSHRYTIINDISGNPNSILLWSTASQGTFNIVLDEPLTVDTLKMSNQCDTYRLVSPNYNGQFEFSLAKNGGQINFFNVDYTYLPYKSYIHVNPAFSELYGHDFDDARGLVCQGDFSLAYLSDAWVNYQVSNKNYANIFARQIENMEVNHKYDRVENIANAAGNAIATGVAAGAMTGNVVVGAAAGVASAAAGVVDVVNAENRFAEEVAYQEDIFNMQLENIRAMPYSIASQTAYCANNKVFPMLEYYTCTIEERRQVATYIANKGMTLGIIGALNEYTIPWDYSDDQFKVTGRGYIKAQLIYIDIDDDSHITQAIAEELRKGVYFNS